MKTPTPTLEEKAEMYENFLHKINSFVICGENEGIRELVKNADDWSYAHSVGNGEHSDRKQQQIINKAFWKLLDTPSADENIRKRQRAFLNTH